MNLNASSLIGNLNTASGWHGKQLFAFLGFAIYQKLILRRRLKWDVYMRESEDKRRTQRLPIWKVSSTACISQIFGKIGCFRNFLITRLLARSGAKMNSYNTAINRGITLF